MSEQEWRKKQAKNLSNTIIICFARKVTTKLLLLPFQWQWYRLHGLTRKIRRRKKSTKEQERLSNQQVDTPFILNPILLFQTVYTIHMPSSDYSIQSIFFLFLSVHSYVSIVENAWKKSWIRFKRTIDEHDRYMYICVCSEPDDLVMVE